MSKKIETKFELQSGDIIERENGNVEIFIKELNTFICTPSGFNSFNELNTDLTSRDNEHWNVVKVYRPKNATQCSFGDIHRYGELIFDRWSVPVEMTMEQVCKALGKNVKIVQ